MSGEDDSSIGGKIAHEETGKTPHTTKTSEAGEEGRQDTGPRDLDGLKKDLDLMKKDLESARNEAETLKNKWLRAEADLDNYRKRVQKEKYENFLYGHEKISGELLPVLDNLERAIEHGKEMGVDQRILEGVELTFKQFLGVLEKHGIVPLSALGKDFDPNVHEAVMEEESREHKPRTITKEIEKGYMLRDRLLRPSKVVVAKAGAPDVGKATAGESAGGNKDKEADNGR